nr:MAG TPA: hypothetical protein [Caudoviricetes sp.]
MGIYMSIGKLKKLPYFFNFFYIASSSGNTT